MEDSFKHKGMRRKMVEALEAAGIGSQRVWKAMEEVPRHFFLDAALDKIAYEDRALRIGCEQTISRPSTVAMQSALLEVEPGMKVLEIGTGSGYQTAVLCRMGARVYTIERQKVLFDKTRAHLAQLGYRAKCFLGDGYEGLKEVDYGPYDRILVTCGAPFVPPALMRQLKVGGLMVVPVGEGEQEMWRIRKGGEAEEEWEKEQYGVYQFVPMKEGRQFG